MDCEENQNDVVYLSSCGGSGISIETHEAYINAIYHCCGYHHHSSHQKFLEAQNVSTNFCPTPSISKSFSQPLAHRRAHASQLGTKFKLSGRILLLFISNRSSHYRTKRKRVSAESQMDKAKERQRKYSLNFTGKSAMQQLKGGLLSIFWWQTQEDGSTRRAESSGYSKKGHFSVVVLKNGEPKKFFVALRYLRNPPFIKLLDAAEQEYGFNQPGAIVIPCGESELENILSEKLK